MPEGPDSIEAHEDSEENNKENLNPIPHIKSTYNIISKVAYLISVPKKQFENEHEPPKIEFYEELDQEALQGSIQKIILFDDIHTSSTWDILRKFIKIPLEHQIIERVKNDKSLVDMKLTVATCQEHFKNGVNDFILFSSDSDYWALISSLPDAHFLMMMEKEKCGPDIKNALYQAGVPFCYINDFCTGNSNEIKTAAMLEEIKDQLEQACCFNINTILQNVSFATRAEMSDTEQRQFYNRYIKPMKLVIDDNGDVSIKLG